MNRFLGIASRYCNLYVTPTHPHHKNKNHFMAKFSFFKVYNPFKALKVALTLFYEDIKCSKFN